MYRCFLTNFGWYLEGEFGSEEEALAHGRSRGFEFSVWEGDRLCGSWSPIGGTTRYPPPET